MGGVVSRFHSFIKRALQVSVSVHPAGDRRRPPRAATLMAARRAAPPGPAFVSFALTVLTALTASTGRALTDRALTDRAGMPTYSDAVRRVRGPSPMDAGDAAARHARATRVGRMSKDPPVHPTFRVSRMKPRPTPAHGGWGARSGHTTRGGSGREGLGNQRGPVDGRPLTLRRHLLAEALATEAENARAEASAEAAAAAWARERMLREAAAQTLWPRLDDVPAGLRCSGEADAVDISASEKRTHFRKAAPLLLLLETSRVGVSGDAHFPFPCE